MTAAHKPFSSTQAGIRDVEKDLSSEIWVQVWPEFEHEWQRWPGAQGSPWKVDDIPEIKVGTIRLTPWASPNKMLMNTFPQLKSTMGESPMRPRKQSIGNSGGSHLLSPDSGKVCFLARRMKVVHSEQWSLKSLGFLYQISKNLLIVVTLM